MNRRWVLALLVATLTAQLSAQEPDIVIPGTGDSSEARLFTPVQLNRPTLVVLIQATLQDRGTPALKTQLQAADSLIKALQSLAEQWGYACTVRAASHAAIHDTQANAYHAASETIRGPALVIARPGSTPRVLRYWPQADRLTEELEDYGRVFRPLVPM
jgi:hypothetical protein